MNKKVVTITTIGFIITSVISLITSGFFMIPCAIAGAIATILLVKKQTKKQTLYVTLIASIISITILLIILTPLNMQFSKTERIGPGTGIETLLSIFSLKNPYTFVIYSLTGFNLFSILYLLFGKKLQTPIQATTQI